MPNTSQLVLVLVLVQVQQVQVVYLRVQVQVQVVHLRVPGLTWPRMMSAVCLCATKEDEEKSCVIWALHTLWQREGSSGTGAGAGAGAGAGGWFRSALHACSLLSEAAWARHVQKTILGV